MTGASSLLVAGVLWSQRLPGPTYESPTEGSPGFAGFVATFALALAVIGLGVSFTRRMRRASHRDRLRAAAGSADGPAGADADAPHGPPAATSPDASADPAADDPDDPAGPPAGPPPVRPARDDEPA